MGRPSMVSPSQLPTESSSAPATYRLVVRSAEEAIRTIQGQWGGQARVISVRQLPGQGLAGLFGRPRLEVIAQVGSEVDSESRSSGLWSDALARAETAGKAAAAAAVVADDGLGAEMPAEANRGGVGEGEGVAVDLSDVLRRAGFSETLRSRLQLELEEPGVSRGPLHRQIAAVGNRLRRLADARAGRGVTDRVAFVGTAGVGRTTALLKWMARQAEVGRAVGRIVHVAADGFVPYALRAGASRVGVAVEAVDLSAGEIAAGRADERMVAEFPALSLTDGVARRAQRRQLEAAGISTRVLVLNALHDGATLRRAAAAGRDLGVTHVAFTHLDELAEWGRLWELLVEGEFAPLFLSTGPSPTGQREDDVVGAVLRRTVPGN